MERISRAENRAAGIAIGKPSASVDYYERKVSLRCTRPGCKRPLAPDSQLCAPHLRRKRKSDRKSAQRRRTAERDAGRCACGCGLKSETWLAPPCAIRLNRIPRAAVGSAVGQAPADPWRRDNDGWQRYRGKGKRGNPSALDKDLDDVDLLAKLVERLRVAVAYARSPEVAEAGRITRQSALDEMDALAGLIGRTVDGFHERHGK